MAYYIKSIPKGLLYIPLGGSKAAESQVYSNLMLTFLIGGFWHGAGWTFLFWGFLHGLGIIINRLWKKTNFQLPKPAAWFITFFFVISTWVFFRAKNFSDALEIIRGMSGLKGVILPSILNKINFLEYTGIKFGDPLSVINGSSSIYYIIIILLFIVAHAPNSNELVSRLKPNWRNFFLLAVISAYLINSLGKVSEFIYFNF